LKAIVTHSERPDAGGLTPSDLPLLSLSQSQVEQLEALYAASNR